MQRQGHYQGTHRLRRVLPGPRWFLIQFPINIFKEGNQMNTQKIPHRIGKALLAVITILFMNMITDITAFKNLHAGENQTKTQTEVNNISPKQAKKLDSTLRKKNMPAFGQAWKRKRVRRLGKGVQIK